MKDMYKIYSSRNLGDLITVVHVTDSNKDDFDKKAFYREGGKSVKFDSKEEAAKFVNKTFKSKYIYEDFILLNENFWDQRKLGKSLH